jgi:hypothetical protein
VLVARVPLYYLNTDQSSSILLPVLQLALAVVSHPLVHVDDDFVGVTFFSFRFGKLK